MNNKDKKQLQKIINKFKELRDKARYRSSIIVENGIIRPETFKAKDEGVAVAYDFCALVLQYYLDGRQLKW